MISHSEFRFQIEGWSWYTTLIIYMQGNPTVFPCWLEIARHHIRNIVISSGRGSLLVHLFYRTHSLNVQSLTHVYWYWGYMWLQRKNCDNNFCFTYLNRKILPISDSPNPFSLLFLASESTRISITQAWLFCCRSHSTIHSPYNIYRYRDEIHVKWLNLILRSCFEVSPVFKQRIPVRDLPVSWS